MTSSPLSSGCRSASRTRRSYSGASSSLLGGTVLCETRPPLPYSRVPVDPTSLCSLKAPREEAAALARPERRGMDRPARSAAHAHRRMVTVSLDALNWKASTTPTRPGAKHSMTIMQGSSLDNSMADHGLQLAQGTVRHSRSEATRLPRAEESPPFGRREGKTISSLYTSRAIARIGQGTAGRLQPVAVSYSGWLARRG
jgi:hypothetical protein